MITSEKWRALHLRMDKLLIKETDLVERFILGSGRGGQKLQKTASTVALHHKPSGLFVKCQESRYRENNRYHARSRICDKMEALQTAYQNKEKQKIEKVKRQKRKRSRRSKLKSLAEKRQKAKIKLLRKPPDHDE